jgi:magnesium chelatase family protein
MVGPPGSGKSMLATRLPGLLPPLTDAEAMEVAGIASISAQGFNPSRWGQRPFRAPHHAASANAIIGGGSRLRAGEISLAHRGVLFLDELPEFDRRVLEALREPLETGAIHLARTAGRLELPAEFQLVAAMNPCPCGYLGDETHTCRCGPRRIQRYRDRISGPLLDRLDLQIEVPRVELPALQPGPEEECPPPVPGGRAAAMARVVHEARERQLGRQNCCNARLDHAGINAHCRAQPAALRLLERVAGRFGLSARAYHRLLKVARTIADLQAAALITPEHIGEAASLRLAAALDAANGPWRPGNPRPP